MGWSFRKRIKVIPGVHLNLSKRGISTSVGVKGANVNFSKYGTTVSTTILGFSTRYKLSGKKPRAKLKPPSDSVSRSQSPSRPSLPLQNRNIPHPFLSDEPISSSNIQEITSQNMQGIKNAITLVHQRKNELESYLKKTTKAVSITKTNKILSYIFLYGFINKDIPRNMTRKIKAQEEAIAQAKSMIEQCYVRFNVDAGSEIKRKFEKLRESFEKLSTSHKIWDITSAHFHDRVAMRSSAGTLVKRWEVRFSLRSLPYIKSDNEALYLQNTNGPDIYIYPTFMMLYASEDSFAIIGIHELSFQQTYTRFTETSSIPRDTKTIDQTWAKVNKNGTPDRRFKNNYTIPVVRYGHINLSTRTGLREEYEFSNYEFTEDFGRAFKDFQTEFKS
ncbi:DUF4236 domain-containing protein [Chryseobacterium sp.]|uniref:DUF4236 domain-containing protein n=1 Tax=Chryseobacterium sp. TaxID=1871047 RepID=UPI0025C00F6D|nr:DUF4236 domain-containing protein [Chryseobacterium sp.]MBV8327792.1 DUF4236 domain-containing protein [Chryseobacterium sp.]